MHLTRSATLDLPGGVTIPRLGLGVFQSPPGDTTRRAVEHALALGYRHVDTAAIYQNERDVGVALRGSGLRREELFVTTKLWNSEHGYARALRACQESLERLGLDYVDLYLIHWPVPELRQESWRALVELQRQGLCRAIGVSNYTVAHLQELLRSAEVAPAVNQVELSPFLVQRELRAFCQQHGIVVEAYSPLTRGQRLGHPTLRAIADRYARTPAQVCIRWTLQHELVTLPKSVTPARIAENADVFDFHLDGDDMARLDALDEDLHVSWDPTGAP